MLTRRDVTDPYGKTVERSGLACRGDGKSSRALIIGSDKHSGKTRIVAVEWNDSDERWRGKTRIVAVERKDWIEEPGSSVAV
jgi:hypothetical protein